MNLAPKMLNNFSHPFVSSAFVREDFTKSKKRPVKVLVVNSIDSSSIDQKERERLYADFLANLDILSHDVERQEGAIDHIDIRMH